MMRDITMLYVLTELTEAQEEGFKQEWIKYGIEAGIFNEDDSWMYMDWMCAEVSAAILQGNRMVLRVGGLSGDAIDWAFTQMLEHTINQYGGRK